MSKLKDRVAVVTGGSSGIGKAAVLKLADEGAKIAIWDINEEAGNQLAHELSDRSIQAIFQKVNTADPKVTQQAAEEVIKQLGRIDILINNAGITRDATIKKMNFEQWEQVISVNLTGVFNCIKAAIPNMIENNFGRIINTSSVVGLYGNFGQTNYAATKSGVIGMTKTLAKELGKHSITVNAVAPGFIATDMVKAMPEKVIEMMVSKTPLGRLGEPDDIADAYAFLASDEASFISGSVLSVDGAVTL
ncbi:3-oxoacyl-[acyl-carrier-protein] reductase [Reichenbachiella faecimaris]|uniref:3-oxoacyl-[acyl-carrier-protein] reductase FabG n=1 Tax=Reichenbachiella faecimaris TaxID=692418 RepID=A0A1W2GMQ2_REIFA|nr:3-oxoacyl-ACP reductase FabG [Reichenbachiella faecimaris]SMD37943.1 3-oxoacyl-[acyl-carrier-protein] reductase [Reichenbachiella faecimaris]